MVGEAILNHGTSRGGLKPDAGIIDLGHEPPLSVDGTEAGVIDRRRISVQWFSGTILTGLCGAALIGGAVFASLDGETTFAMLPEKVEGALRGAIGSNEHATTRKADRLPPPSESANARQVIRVSTATRIGSREVMRVRPFIRVAGNLSMTTSELSARIPAFNAQRLLTDVGTAAPAADDAAAASAEPDAEVSFVTRDLAQALPRVKIAGILPLESIEMSVREAVNFRDGSGARYAVASIAPGLTDPGAMRLAYAAEGKIDPYAGFEARIVPENVTLLPKMTKDQAQAMTSTAERNVVARKGDTLLAVLRDQGATAEEARAIISALGLPGRDGTLREGVKLRILMAASAPGKRLQPVRVIVANDTAVESIIALSDLGKYVSVDVASFNAATQTASAAADDDDDESEGGVRLYNSIYETAMRDKVPMPVIEDMIRIYSYDVDFQRKTQPGDSFEVFYAGEDETPGSLDAKNEVLYAALTVDGETKKYYRFQTNDDGVVDYYDETGKSAKKFLVRKPVNNGIMRSGFGGRVHPILGYTRAHTGVDWAAPYGTPIFASGNGTVEKVGWEGGYGKFVLLKHSNGYETAYGHMTAYAKGIEPGKNVRQGQVIGFVGSTGLSTGAHVHYEIRVNGRFVDPMRIRLPRGRSLEGSVLAGFEQERDRLEGMMKQSGNRVAQTSQPNAR